VGWINSQAEYHAQTFQFEGHLTGFWSLTVPVAKDFAKPKSRGTIKWPRSDSGSGIVTNSGSPVLAV
jgi:hypothetical protein